MKRALVLSGGGNKGAFEVGVLHQLITGEHLDFDLFSGTSVGALNAAFLAQGANWEEQAANIEILKSKWLNISGNKEIYDYKPSNLMKLLFGGALYEPLGLQNLIQSLISPGRLAKGKPLLVPTVSLEDGALYIADSRKPEDRRDMSRFLLASASIPVYFPTVEIRGKHWVDGGLRNMTPLNAVLNEMPTEIVVVTTYPITSQLEPLFPKFTEFKNIFAVIHRIIDILASEVAVDDLRITRQVYSISKNLFRKGGLTIITPGECINEKCLDFSPKILSKYYELGVKAVRNL